MGTIFRRGDLPPVSLSRDRSAGNKSLEMHPPFREPFVLRTLVGHWRDLENERSCVVCAWARPSRACTLVLVQVCKRVSSSPVDDRRSFNDERSFLSSLLLAAGWTLRHVINTGANLARRSCEQSLLSTKLAREHAQTRVTPFDLWRHLRPRIG